MDFLAARGVVLERVFDLTAVTALLSNTVSNVPAVMLLVKVLNPAQTASWTVAALSSTFAGNLITIGSIANLIVIESAREYGVTIRFAEHARAGVPITVFSLLVIVFFFG
jgi:Na+/H+ antiporter NhaD/arsenite permease-like protein